MNTTTITTNPPGLAKWKTFGWHFLVLFLLGFAPAWAQTDRIPVAEGAFSNPGGFGGNGWSVSNGASPNHQWVVSSAHALAAPFSGDAAFVSNNGTAYAYTPANNANVFFWRDVTVPIGEPIMSLTFDWNQQGEAGWDIWQVFVAPTTINPVGNNTHPGNGATLIPAPISGATYVGNGAVIAGIQTFTGSIPTSFAGTTFRLIFSWKNETGGVQPPAAIDNIRLTSAAPATFTATALGGLWNSPATWAGGVVPAAGNDIDIPNGSTVTVNQVLNYRDLTLNGNLQWATTNAATFTRNVTVSNTGNLFLSTPGLTGQTLNIGGNLTNNGSINAAAGSTFINFNGTGNSEISGTGTFVGTGGRGIIRTLGAQNNGTFTLTNPQNITLTNQVINTSNNFVTNGRLRIDNAVDVFQSNVSQVVLTAMGSGYTTAPVVLGQAVNPWVASGTALINTRYFVGTNVYLCTVAGTFDVTAPVNTTPATEANGTATVIWVGNLGNLGNSFQTTAVTAGTQYYCGDNLYLCTVAGTPTSAAPPVHTSGTAASGTATFAYVGTVAKASLNWDVTTQTVRSMNLVSAGSGYQTIPACIISNTGAGTGATATSVVFLAAGPGNSIATKATASIFTGSADPRHSDAPAGAAGNGVYSATANTYGWYNSAVATGFSLPPLVNLVTAQGSGFTAAPTIVVSGGTVVTGTALTASAFQVNVAGGRIISLYCTTPGTTTYSVPPTITVTGGGGTGATFSWGTSVPTATVNLSNGTNGFITGINITNNGYGYVAAPTIAFRAAVAGEIAASSLSCRLQQLNIQYSFFLPQTTNPNNNSIMALVPSNGRINAIGAGIGAQTFTSNIEITALVPLVSTFGNVIDMGGSNNVRFSHPDYVGQTGTVGAFVANGSVELSFRGGNTTSATRTFPIGGGTGATAHFVHVTGLGTATTGFTYTGMRVSRFNTPSGTVSPGGNITGIRGVRADLIGTGVLTNLNSGRTVTMFWNILDNLVSDNASIFLADATAPAGPWTVRSTAGVAGALATTGNRLSASAAPGPYANNATMYFAWANNGFTPPPALAYNVTRTTGNTYTSIASLAKGGNGTGVAFTGWSAFPLYPNDEEQTTLTLTSWSSNFQGAPITGIRVYTNGFIQILTATTPAAPSTSWDNGMARTDLPNVVAAFWDDLINKSAGGNTRDNSIIHSITGTSPNRVLTVEWANMTPFGADAAAQLAFQIQLFEATGEIRVNYGDNQMFNGTVERRYSYSVGIKGRYNTAYPQAGQVFAQQFENYNLFSPIRTQTPHLGANGMAVSPEPRSSFSFTPGVYTPPALPGTTPPDNDDFASYELISSLSVFPNNVAWNVPDNKSRLYSTRFATTSSPANCGTGPVNQKDVWFVFEANEVAVTSRIYPSGGYIARVEAFTTTGTFPGLSLGSSIACNVGPQGLVTDLNLTGLTIGNYYAVRVSHDRVGTAATFAATAVANGNLSGVSITGGGTNYTSATPTFNGPNGIRLKPTGGGGSTFVGEVNAITAGAVTGATFDGGNDYSSIPSIVVEQPDWGITGDFAIVIYAPPINDDCVGAIELTGIATSTCTPGANQLLGVSTASATPSTELSGPCNANDEDDLWYRFTATGTLTNVSVQGNAGFDPALRLWSGADCAVKVALNTPNPAGGCLNATGTNGLEEVSLITVPGTIYYIRVYDANPGSGPFGANFDICVTTPVPACASGLIPAASETVCGGSATSVSWSATPFAASYDVFFDAGAGPASTNVSPAQVGLTYNAGVLAAGFYTYRIVPKNANGDAVGCSDITFEVISPTPSSTTPDSRCGTGTVTLTAAGSNLQWWTAPTGGVPVGTGTSFTTPSISATTNYYVSAGVPSSGLVQVGTQTTTTNTSGITPYTALWESQGTQYIFRASELIGAGLSAGNLTSLSFTVTTLVGTVFNDFSIGIAHTAANAVAGYVANLGPEVTVFSSPSITATVGVNTYTFTTPFNWNGTDNIYVRICNDFNPFTTSTTVAAMTTSFNSTYGEYDDGITICANPGFGATTGNATTRPIVTFAGQTLCSGPRTLVTATVTPPPALTLDQSAITLCEGATEAINVTSTVGDFDSYVWSTPGEFSGTAGTGFTFNSTGASAGIRTLTATDGVSGCVNTATVNATVNPRPPVGTATATPNPVCEGTTLALDVTGFLPVPNTALVTQNFESGLAGWTIAAASTTTGLGNPLLANFRIVNHNAAAEGTTGRVFNSPGAVSHLLSHSDAAGSGSSANTQFTSPVFSLANYTGGSLTFRHHINGSIGTLNIQSSIDGGTTWNPVPLASYTTTIGTLTNFAAATVSLNTLAGQSNVRIRFNVVSGWGWFWAIDDIAITGTTVTASTFAWESDLNGPIGSGRPFNYNAIPQSEDGAFFTVRNTITATGCFREATTATAIDVTPRPDPIVLSLPDGTVYCGVPIEFTASSVGSDEITWGPVVGLTTDNIGTLPYPANFNLGTVYLSSPITATGTYVVTATSTVTGCFRTSNIDFTTCPPSSDFPCDADNKPLLPVNTLGGVTMSDANNLSSAATFLPGQGISAPSCFGTYNRDVWFRSRVPASGVLAINIQNNVLTPMDLIADVFTSSNNLCSGTFTQVACNDQSGFGVNPWLQVTTLAPNQLIYIRVSRKGNGASPVGQFQIGLSEGAVWSGAFNNNMLQQTDDVNGDNNWRFIDNTRLVDIANPVSIVIPNGVGATFPVLSTANFTVSNVFFRRISGSNSSSANLTVGTTRQLTLVRAGTSNTGNLSTNIFNGTGTFVNGPGIFNFGTLIPGPVNTYNMVGSAANSKNVTFTGVVAVRDNVTLNSNGNMIFANNSNLLSGNVNRGGVLARGNVVGNITYTRIGSNIPGVYNYWSSPITAAPISRLNNFGVGNNIYLYDNTRPGAAGNVLLGWEGPITATSTPTNTAATMIPGKGYIQTAAGTSAGVVTFTGAPQQSALTSIPVTRTSTNGFNLVGNPYPSYLDLSGTGAGTFFTTNTTVNGVYLWRNTSLPPYLGAGYVTMTSVGVSGSTTPGGFTAPQIGAAQGFMVDVSVATSLQFVGGMRGTGEPTNNPQFLDVNEFSTARVRIFNADESQSYETMLAFKDDATDEIDHQQDAVRFPVPLGLEVYTINGNNNFVIQALPTLHNGRIIPLGTQMGEANGSYKIRLTEFSNFESSTRVYIEDLATGAFHNLSQNNTYDFVNMPWTGQRFKLHFRAPIAMAASGACAGDASGKLILNNPNPTAATLTVKNAEGMTIAQESNWMGDKVINNLSTGNYNVAIAYDANDVINMNASIANGSLTAPAAFTASSTVVTLEDASIQFAGNNNGATTYSWNFGDGNTVNGVLNPVHTYSAAGQYTVTFTTSSNGCESTTTKVINVSNGTVGINDIANGNSFSIYPNPSADIAYVMLNMAANEKDVMVTILDGAGRVVSKERVNEVRNGSVVTLNVSEIANGIYEVVVENKNFRAVGKLSVTH